ncbi:hypothetical protein SLE2022_130840 [Rubroshorea leprosula]
MDKIFPLFLKGISWSVNKGNQINFLHNDWLHFGPLNNLIYGLFPQDRPSFMIANAFTFHSSISELHYFLPSSIETSILSIFELVNPHEEDWITWKLTPTGAFSLFFAYNSACNFSSSLNESSWQWLWKCPSIPKIKFFLWLLDHDRSPSRLLLSSLGIQIPTACLRCNSSPRSALHLFVRFSYGLKVLVSHSYPLKPSA